MWRDSWANLRLDSFNAAPFEGAFDASLQSLSSTVRELEKGSVFIIIVMIISGGTPINLIMDFEMMVIQGRALPYKSPLCATVITLWWQSERMA